MSNPSAVQLPQQVPQPHVFPVDPPSTHTQESNFIENNRYLKNEHQFTYYKVPGANYGGPSRIDRLRLAFESGLSEEVDFALKTLVTMSCSPVKQMSAKTVVGSVKPPQMSLKTEYSFLIDYLALYFDCQVFNSNAENSDLDKSLDSALILRNLAQDIDNSQVISLSMPLREVLLHVVKNPVILNDEFSDPQYAQCRELLRYTMDIVEAISSYLAPAPADDALFSALIQLLQVVTDRSTITTVLRSLSRMMYNAKDSGDCPDSLPDSVLNLAVSYLALATDTSTGQDELLLTALDFIYQFVSQQSSRVDRLLASDDRASMLITFLPRLLVYKLDYRTEFTQEMPMLQLIRRVQEPVPEKPPTLTQALIDELNSLDEPDRATAWLRCSFEASPDAEVTQIVLWRCYEAQFAQYMSSQHINLLPAVNFIKNVQSAFPHSSAMVINMPNAAKKFIIRGIRPRHSAVSIAQGKSDALLLSPQRANATKQVSVNAKHSMQQPYQLFEYNFNDYLELNDINTSASLLLNALAECPIGIKLFTGHKNDLIDKLMCVPNLFPYIYDTLRALDY